MFSQEVTVSQEHSVTLQSTEHRIPIVNDAVVLLLVIDEKQRYFTLILAVLVLFNGIVILV